MIAMRVVVEVTGSYVELSGRMERDRCAGRARLLLDEDFRVSAPL
ncbi:hypothetical protein [Lentzea sp.]